jgi:hypothetical protein
MTRGCHPCRTRPCGACERPRLNGVSVNRRSPATGEPRSRAAGPSGLFTMLRLAAGEAGTGSTQGLEGSADCATARPATMKTAARDIPTPCYFACSIPVPGARARSGRRCRSKHDEAARYQWPGGPVYGPTASSRLRNTASCVSRVTGSCFQGNNSLAILSNDVWAKKVSLSPDRPQKGPSCLSASGKSSSPSQPSSA